ncbi:hypothetical protein HDU96_003568 [Phlyctochytrium bullatum]|nr:hypothetical protein HDU96_003568 [Phlyctochytrium bullatum]
MSEEDLDLEGEDVFPPPPAATLRSITPSRFDSLDSDEQYDLGQAYVRGAHRLPVDLSIARLLFQKAAARKHALAQTLLGHFHEKGLGGLERNLGEAVSLYRAAANQGDGAAMFYLAQLVRSGAATDDGRPDLPAAAELLRRAAERGHLDAQSEYGDCLRLGTGVARDLPKAASYYMAASEKGHPGAQAALAEIYEEGIPGHTEQNPSIAFELYHQSAGQDHPAGKAGLGHCYQKGIGTDPDPALALKYFREAAEKGDPRGQRLLGALYESGQGVEKDPRRAFEFFNAAAETGDVEALCSLGMAYLEGRGVPKDAAKAAEVFQAAAEKESITGLMQLGYCYEKGIGVPPDVPKAAELYARAAEGGNPNACCNLANFCRVGAAGVPKDPRKAMELYTRAALKGNAVAQYNLGVFYQSGAPEMAVEKDLSMAASFFRSAAEGGHAKAQAAYGYCLAKGIGVDQDLDEALMWLKKSADQHNATAQHMFGLKLMEKLKANGARGNPVLKKDAIAYLSKAAEQNNMSAILYLGNYYLSAKDGETNESLDRACRLFEQAGKMGSLDAQMIAAHLLESGKLSRGKDLAGAAEFYSLAGERGGNAKALRRLATILASGGLHEGDAAKAESMDSLKRQDFRRAVDLYYRAAEKGDIPSQRILGSLYLHGNEHLEKNNALALRFYSIGAESGDPDCLVGKAFCLENGIGCLQNLEEALDLYRVAVDKGNMLAMRNLANILSKGIDGLISKDHVTAFGLFKRAAELGDDQAMNNVGFCYENGMGVEPDSSKAFEWYARSAELGNAVAENNVAICYEKGVGVDANLELAVKYYQRAVAHGNPKAEVNFRRAKRALNTR